MLGGKISNQDEDEVEQELEALENDARLARQDKLPPLPKVPSDELPASEVGTAPLPEPGGRLQPSHMEHGEQQAMLA